MVVISSFQISNEWPKCEFWYWNKWDWTRLHKTWWEHPKWI